MVFRALPPHSSCIVFRGTSTSTGPVCGSWCRLHVFAMVIECGGVGAIVCFGVRLGSGAGLATQAGGYMPVKGGSLARKGGRREVFTSYNFHAAVRRRTFPGGQGRVCRARLCVPLARLRGASWCRWRRRIFFLLKKGGGGGGLLWGGGGPAPSPDGVRSFTVFAGK